MLVSGALSQDTEFKLLFLILHFLLALEQNLSNEWKCLLNSLFSEFAFFDFVPCHLLSSARGAAVVLEAGAARLNHVELLSLVHVVDAEDDGGAVRSEVCIDCAHLELESKSVSQSGSRNLHMELVLVLLALISRFLNHSTAIWRETVDNTSAVDGDGVEALVRASEHHLVDDNLLGAEDDSVLAMDSEDGAEG